MREFLSPKFVTCFVVLVVAAIGMRPTIGALSDTFSKHPVEIRTSLLEFDLESLPSYVAVPDGERYTGASEEDLGTAEWMSMAFREKDASANDPTTVLFVTYYSDPRDQVPHTPEVCFQQSGAQVSRFGKITIPTPSLGPETPEVEVRRLQAELPGLQEQLMYVFVSNGRFYADRQKLRLSIGLPGEKRTYFSKVEVLTVIQDEDDVQAARARCARLLDEALGSLLEHSLPTDEDLAQPVG